MPSRRVAGRHLRGGVRALTCQESIDRPVVAVTPEKRCGHARPGSWTMSPRLAVLLLSVCLAIGAPRAAAAQSRFVGLSVDRYYPEYGAFFALTYRQTDIGRYGGGLDLGVGLVPSALLAHALLTTLDLGVAKSVPAGPATVLLRAGSSNVVGAAEGFLLYPGVQLGGGILVAVDPRSYLRLDLSRHVYYMGGESTAMWSLGLGVAARGTVRF